MKDKIKEQLLNTSVQIDLQGTGVCDVIFKGDFDELAESIVKLFALAPVVKPKGTFCVWCKKNEQLDFTAICKECYDNHDR